MTGIIGYDPHNIVPRGAAVATVKPFEFQVRTLVDYDVTYMQDRVRSDVFVNGKPCGVYACAVVEEFFSDHGRAGLEEAMRIVGPDLERMVVDEFMGLGYRKRVRELEDKVQKLQAHINRVRWWQLRRIYRGWRMSRFVL